MLTSAWTLLPGLQGIAGKSACQKSVLLPYIYTTHLNSSPIDLLFTDYSFCQSSSFFIFFRSVTGCFIDNHDHYRFLFKNLSYVSLRNNLVFVFMSQCIPLLYYGTDGNDPHNRESLWPYFNQTHEMYVFIKQLLQIRKNLSNNWLKTPQIERHVSPNVYSFSRGKILMVITTEPKTITSQIKAHPYDSG